MQNDSAESGNDPSTSSEPAPQDDSAESGNDPSTSSEPAPQDDSAESGNDLDSDATDPAVRVRRREQAAQAVHESEQPRESLATVAPPEPPKWQRRLEIGASFAFVLRPFAEALGPTDISYAPAPGFQVHLHWPVFDWLRFNPYFLHAFQALEIPPGALTSGTANSIGAEATISDASVATFVLGAKIAPTLNFSDRWRGWLTAGIGWGRFEFPTMTVTENDGTSYEIRERAAVVVEFPLGAGIAFDVIERWMSIHYEATAAPITGQSGAAHEVFQAVDADGEIRDVGGFGAIEASFVQTLGVSLIL